MAESANAAPPPRRDVLLVDGMFCAACAASVEAALGRMPGVAGASVSFPAAAAVVDWRDERGDVDNLIARIRQMGYRAQRPDGRAGDVGAGASRAMSLRLVVAVFFGMWVMLPSIVLYLGRTPPDTARWLAIAAGIAATPVVAWCGLPFYRMGVATLRHGVAGVDALVSLGVAGAVALSLVSLAAGGSDVYFEVAVALITLQLLARLFDQRTRVRARDAVSQLLRLAPASLSVRVDDGRWLERPVVDVAAGTIARVPAGQRVPVDASVTLGDAHVDRSLTTGESAPVRVVPGDALLAGELVLDGLLQVRVESRPGSRRVDALANQVRELLGRKPAWQRGVDTLARNFLWSALALSVAACIAALAAGETGVGAATRALSVFVIACPCALSLAAPLAGYFAAAAAARAGIVLRDLNAIAGAAEPDQLFVDKTGTLTRVPPRVVAIHPSHGIAAAEVLAVAAAAEAGSAHPLARAILDATEGVPATAMAVREVRGRGVRAEVAGAQVLVGSLAWLADEGMQVPHLSGTTTSRVGVACAGKWIGAIDIADAIRPGAESALRALGLGPGQITMLSGDRAAAVAAVAEPLGLAWRAELSPEDKVAEIERARARGLVVAFVGDGLNDGPALAAADIGIAVGGATDAARAAAAATLVERGIEALPDLFRITARARRIVRQNLAWAIVYNAAAVPAAMLGYVHPAVAAVAMTLSSVTVVGNAARLLASGAPDEPRARGARQLPSPAHGT